MSSYTVQEDEKWEIPALGIVSGWFGVVLITITAVSRIISQSSVIADGLATILIALLLASLVYVLLAGGRNLKLAAIPLILNVWTLLIVEFVPFEQVWEQARFRWHLNGYQEVIYLVESGQLRPNEQGEITLPAHYHSLSADNGRILAETDEGMTQIIFFTRYNAPRDFSGYLYRSDNTPPRMSEFGGRWRHVVQVRPNWFFCESY